MQTLVVLALKVESQGLFEASGFHPLYCGVGAVKATHNLTKWIFEHKPKQVINLGTAGSHAFKVGQLVECISFVQRHPHDFFKLPSEKIQAEKLTNLASAVCGSADFIESAAPITPCDVFDMEAYSLAYVCQKMKVPFHSLKFITDASNETLATDWTANLKFSAESLLNELRKLKIEKN